MDELLITSNIDKSSSGQVNFKNPFNEPTNIEIFFDDNTTWALLLKRRKLLVPPLSQLLIPVSFAPRTMQESHTEVVVQMPDKNLTWRFPVQGIAERASEQLDYVFRVRTREVLE
jgi:hypothetical protein